MKATELRLNNYIETKDGKIEQVFTLNGEGINGYDGCGGIYLDDQEDFKPILLTDKWLNDLGFKEWAEGNWKKYKDKNGWPSQWNYYLPYKNLGLYVGNATIQYVHQLQNLYFALTGKELTKP